MINDVHFIFNQDFRFFLVSGWIAKLWQIPIISQLTERSAIDFFTITVWILVRPSLAENHCQYNNVTSWIMLQSAGIVRLVRFWVLGSFFYGSFSTFLIKKIAFVFEKKAFVKVWSFKAEMRKISSFYSAKFNVVSRAQKYAHSEQGQLFIWRAYFAF